ncbi:hypothetical protein HU200_022686 [Digitaria exilis]|uniref:Uncharacterized protein n=1 Tax=Digitaria exilis TaxID=1010633 RepID=A0A835C2H5_9POAL|nr:hypothetical protein HU200_022686 [Digitaria exilis]
MIASSTDPPNTHWSLLPPSSYSTPAGGAGSGLAGCSADRRQGEIFSIHYDFSPIPMGHGSAEDSDVSDSDIVEHKEKTYAQLRGGKWKVKYGENAFRCPFCPGKKKQDYNLKDLLQHATGIGAAHKRSAKVKATHLGLAMFLEKDIASSLEKPLQIVPYKPKTPKSEEEVFVWPWMGIVANLPYELEAKEFSRGCEERLKAQLSRFRPLQVTILGDDMVQTFCLSEKDKDRAFCAIVKFAKDWSGFKDALAFEKHFVFEQYGKADWYKIKCKKDDIYGWLARSDDYNSPGPIGKHLRENGDLRSVGDLEREGMQETGKRVAHYALQIEVTSEHMRKLEQKNNQNAMKLDRMMEEKDRLVEEHNKKMRKMQEDARRNSRKIIDQNIKLNKELEARKKEIDRKSKQLEKLAMKSNTNTEKLEVAKQENAKENMLINLATQKKTEQDVKLLRLVKHHEQEKEHVVKMLYNLENQLASKQKLELEIEQLTGNLEVMRHMGDADANLKKKVDELRKTLEEKSEEMEAMDSLNQTLVIKERRTNDELEEAKKVLTTELPNMFAARSLIGVRRMGEPDKKAFFAACKGKTAQDDDELTLLFSKWEDEIRHPEWHPFKVIEVDGQAKLTVTALVLFLDNAHLLV